MRQRRYRGFCTHNDQARAVLSDIAARRAELMAIIDATPQLNGRSRDRVDGYMSDFFDDIGAPQKVTDVLKSCLG